MGAAAQIRLQGAGFDLALRLGGAPAQPAAGGAQWDEVSRPERSALTDYTGDALLRMDVPVLLDGFRESRSIEPELGQILALSRSPGDGERPPDFIATGPIPYSGLRCVMDPPAWADDPPSYRTAAGVLVRQALTLKLIEFNDPDTISFRDPPSAAGAKGAKGPKTYTTKAGETLYSIAVKIYGLFAAQAGKAKQIGKLNGIRDTRKKLKAGIKLRLP